MSIIARVKRKALLLLPFLLALPMVAMAAKPGYSVSGDAYALYFNIPSAFEYIEIGGPDGIYMKSDSSQVTPEYTLPDGGYNFTVNARVNLAKTGKARKSASDRQGRKAGQHKPEKIVDVIGEGSFNIEGGQVTQVFAGDEES